MSEALLTPLVGAFADGLAGALELMIGARPQIDVAAAPAFDATQLLLWRQPLGGMDGTAWVAVAETAWRDIGSNVLRAAGVEDGDEATLRSTFLEMSSQALSALATAMTALARHEVTCGYGELDQNVPGQCVWFRLNFSVGVPAEMVLGFDRDLIRALGVASAAGANAAAAATAAAGSAAAATSDPESPAGQKSRTFDLLLEVELPVSVSFGRAHVALRDVLKLTTGSIVELNRHINEPVEVIVNNCVIARGEVVVVEGNFGVRIQQVISRQERLRTLN